MQAFPVPHHLGLACTRVDRPHLSCLVLGQGPLLGIRWQSFSLYTQSMGFLVHTIQKNEKTMLQPTGMVVFIALKSHVLRAVKQHMSQICGHFIRLVSFSPEMRGHGGKLCLKTRTKPQAGTEQLKCSGVQCPRPPPGHLLFTSIGIPYTIQVPYTLYCTLSAEPPRAIVQQG